MLSRAPHITSLYIYFLCFLFILIALSIEMTRTKKSTTTTSPLKSKMLRRQLRNLTRVPRPLRSKEPNVKNT